jgi:hypothetical protein
LHERQPVTAVLADSRARVARSGTRASALFPFDWVRWTEELHRSSLEIAARAKKELGARTLEARVSGTATPAARAGLAAAGWAVSERAVNGLAVLPAR